MNDCLRTVGCHLPRRIKCDFDAGLGVGDSRADGEVFHVVSPWYLSIIPYAGTNCTKSKAIQGNQIMFCIDGNWFQCLGLCCLDQSDLSGLGRSEVEDPEE